MPEKFRNRYRIQSARAPWWDYGRDAAYFITILTKNRQPFFGNIVAGKMQLSPLGVIADLLWYEIKNHSKNCELGEFVVMPDHMHGVLILQGNDLLADGSRSQMVETRHALSLPFGIQPIQPNPFGSIPNKISPAQSRFQNQGKNTISSIVGSYKSAVTKHAHRLGFQFAWQPRFHDRIIRDDVELQRISNYIRTNLENWTKEDAPYRSSIR